VARVRDRHLARAQARDRRVELEEGLLLDARRDLGRKAAAAPALVDDERAMRARDRFEQRRGVERAQHAQVDHLRLDALGGEPLGGLERARQHPAVGDDREVAPGTAHRRAVDRHRPGVLGELALHRVQAIVLE